MQAAQLGVEPNTPLGQAYLIPYRNHGQLECQFQLGYKGLIDLAYRSGEITSISAHEVCENDDFEYELSLDEKLKHKPALKANISETMTDEPDKTVITVDAEEVPADVPPANVDPETGEIKEQGDYGQTSLM